MPRKNVLDFAAMRQRLAGEQGDGYWRSLDELAQTEEFQESLALEFSAGADVWPHSASRRSFLKLMAASLSLAGLTACQQPEEKILPYVEMPEQIVPGVPLFFATAMPLEGLGLGVLAESHMGRPTKIEGNPQHPASLGATDPFAQASVLTLYDPNRSKTPLHRGVITSREAFEVELAAQLDRQRELGGRGLRILTGSVTSPTFVRQMSQIAAAFPQSRWHQFEPLARDNALRGAELAFGRPLEPLYDFSQADVVLALDADFLSVRGWPIPYAHSYMQRRRPVGGTGDGREMNRLYVLESSFTVTGSKADHRLALSPRDIASVVALLAQRLGVAVDGAEELPENVSPEFIEALVDDLQNYRLANNPGTALLIAGPSLPASTQALVHAINAQLGAVGRAVSYIEPVRAQAAPQVQSLAQLVDEMQRGEVQVLLIIDSNPVFTAPADLQFAKAMKAVPFSVHSGLFADATADTATWHLPSFHYLESWSDVRAYNGVASIIQPLIAPLYDGFNTHELLALVAGERDPQAHNLVRETWSEALGGANFEIAWEDVLRHGVVPNTAAMPVEAEPNVAAIAAAVAQEQTQAPSTANTLTALFRPDPTIYDGRFATNTWLQELPKPLTKIVWDSAAHISPRLAEKLQLATGDVVRIAAGERQIEMPIWILPGHADDCFTLPLGYGERLANIDDRPVGHDVYPLRTTAGFWSVACELKKTRRRYQLATTQPHQLLEDRQPVLHGTLAEMVDDPAHPSFMPQAHSDEHASLLPEWKYDGNKWGMAIDLTACTGCSACVVACQSENNIPVVGKEQVLHGREMHWLRVDTYFQGDLDTPTTFHQPVPCMHCEKAPCEVVCPVAATTHSDEGINEMTYNRCVGTRYCSNNCPYKVRRFNYLEFSYDKAPVLALLQNPNVTVRSRGVMEKCTYCVQRVNAARISAEKQQRPIRAGEVVTACQSVCPVQAISFGNLNNSAEAVTAWKQSPLNYALLGDLNTQPRTTYLAEVTNPNPRLQPARTEEASHG